MTKQFLISHLAFLLASLSPVVCTGADSENGAVAPAPSPAPIVISVNSPAFVFSPGNWAGNDGRGGEIYRQTWCSGAYFRVSWKTISAPKTPKKATILLDTSTFGSGVKNLPQITYNVDGVWKSDIPCNAEIPVDEASVYFGEHTLTVYLQNSEQANRWGSPGVSGLNVLRVTGLRVEAGSSPLPAKPKQKWLLEVGDSITEGIGTDGNLSDYSYFVGQAMQTQGYEYGVSACGYSGWICKGDGLGDVPAYYAVSGSVNGEGGKYDDGASRWNKINANQTLLDAKGHLSAYGETGQEPSIITINYGTNEAFTNANQSDLQASITQGLEALRGAAPDAQIFMIIPFGQHNVKVIEAALSAFQLAHPADPKVGIIDLGQKVALGASEKGYWSGVHPNLRAHATFAAQITAAIQARLRTSAATVGR